MIGDNGDVLLYLAGVYWEGMRGTDHHLVEQLSRHIPVIWVDPPLSIVHPARQRDLARLKTLAEVSDVHPGVRRVRLLAPPFPNRRGMERLTTPVLRRGLRGAIQRLGVRVVAVVNSTPYVGFAVAPRARGAKRLYYATDDFVAGADLLGLSVAGLRRAERARTTEADLLCAVTPAITARWTDLGKPTYVLPNGCSPEMYAQVDQAARAHDVTLRGPVAGLVGQVSARTDLALVEAVAGAGVDVLIVGPLVSTTDGGRFEARFEALVRRDNVQWVGAKPFEELPPYLGAIDVGLTPYTMSDFNKASFPLKTLEYISAGRPVASTPLPAVEQLGSLWVHTAESPEDYAELVRTLAGEVRTPELIAERRAFAYQHSWSSRAQRLLELLGLDVVGEGGSSTATRAGR